MRSDIDVIIRTIWNFICISFMIFLNLVTKKFIHYHRK